jgi:hypothetical protein
MQASDGTFQTGEPTDLASCSMCQINGCEQKIPSRLKPSSIHRVPESITC